MIRSRSVCQGSTGRARPSFLGEQGRDPRAVVTQRRERARRAAELHGQPPRADLGQPLAGLVHAGQPARRDQPEGDRDGLLEQRPADHDRGPVRGGQPGGRAGGLRQVGLDHVDGPPGQQHGGRVHDVLAGGAAVHGAGRGLRDPPGQGPGQGGNRVPGQGGQLAELAGGEVARLRRLGDGRAGARGRQPGPFQRPGQPGLGVQHRLQPRGVASLGRAAREDPPEQPPRPGSSWSAMDRISPSSLLYPAPHDRPQLPPHPGHRGHSAVEDLRGPRWGTTARSAEKNC